MMMHAYRSHTCAALNKSNVGETVRLSGWVHRVRDHGGVLFIDLRDHYGITQCCAMAIPGVQGAGKVRAEWVIRVDGRVKARDASLVNAKIPTGEIEVYATGSRCWARPRNCRCRSSAIRNTPRKPG
jgi:aspartyl-tRNA synthetase